MWVNLPTHWDEITYAQFINLVDIFHETDKRSVSVIELLNAIVDLRLNPLIDDITLDSSVKVSSTMNWFIQNLSYNKFIINEIRGMKTPYQAITDFPKEVIKNGCHYYNMLFEHSDVQYLNKFLNSFYTDPVVMSSSPHFSISPQESKIISAIFYNFFLINNWLRIRNCTNVVSIIVENLGKN